MGSRISGLEGCMCFGQTNLEWSSVFSEVAFDAHKGTWCATLQLTSARLRSFPTLSHVHVRGCGQGRLPDLLSVCLQLFLFMDHPLQYGRQLAVSWCTSRVHFGAGLNIEPLALPRLPPACFFALAGVIRSRGG